MRKYDISDISFSNGGLFTSSGEWIHSERIIDSNELIVVTNGTVYIEEDGNRMELEKGDFCILRKGVRHRGYKKSADTVSFYWLHFYGDFSDPPRSGTLSDLPLAVQEIKHLLQISATENYLPKTADCAFYVILSEILYQNISSSAKNTLASKVYEYIRSHSAAKLTAQSVGRHFDYDPNYLSKVLKKAYGKNLNQCIIEGRISLAKLLLSTTNYTLSKISDELGYFDSNLFIKFFKYNTGSTPLEYRNGFINQHTNHI